MQNYMKNIIYKAIVPLMSLLIKQFAVSANIDQSNQQTIIILFPDQQQVIGDMAFQMTFIQSTKRMFKILWWQLSTSCKIVYHFC